MNKTIKKQLLKDIELEAKETIEMCDAVIERNGTVIAERMKKIEIAISERREAVHTLNTIKE